MRRYGKWVLLAATAFLLVSGGIIALAAHRVETEGQSAIKSTLSELPHEKVAVVLGCSPTLKQGTPNAFFDNRMAAAAAVFKAGKVDYLLVSGDNRRAGYDEPTAMRDALLRLGVPEKRIVLDYAGFTTLDSILRAKEVFGLTQFCIISQRDHAMRAAYIAKRNGIQPVAFPADDVDSMLAVRVRIRESLARVRALADTEILHRKPHFLGPKIQIGTEKTGT